MRLLQLSEGGELSLTSHETDHVPPYAILSHTWGPTTEELTLQDVEHHRYQDKAGFAKVRFCGDQAKKDGYDYFWVDSCCIDKTSSAELSESINSMFRWYAEAAKCYVYLQDVGTRKRDSAGQSDSTWREAFRKSRWFTRGWTLQELLAPKVVQFFSRDRELLGDQNTLEAEISSVTKIPVQALRGTRSLADFPPNERLCWLQGRQTSVREDMAYCLLGILGVSLPVIYGEGEQQAFVRLKEAAGRHWSYLDSSFITKSAIGTQGHKDDATLTGSVTDPVNHRAGLMRSLAFDQMDSRHATIKKAQHSTCAWILQHPTYVAWDSADETTQEQTIFWINGKPGAGKSTLLKFVYTQMKKNKRRRNEILASFFFNARGDDLEKTTTGMYRSLLLQLLKEAPDLQHVFDEIDGAQEATDFASFWTLEILQDVFATAVAGLGDRRVSCVIDALDECNEKQVRDMVAQFEDLAESAIESGIRLRICFASRHYPEIRAQKALSMILETQDGHSRDLEKFIRKQLDAGNSEHDEQIRTRIREKSNGVFMWTVLVVDILNTEYRKGRMWAIERKLEEIPGGLGDLLRDILRRDSVDMEGLLLCLQWILFAKRPLKLEEFYCAMETGLTDQPPQRRDAKRDETQAMVRFVTSSSKGLAELIISEKPTVQFIHESVRDFLLKDGGLCELWSQLDGRALYSSHERLKECCHKYLSVDISVFAPPDEPLPKASSPEGIQLRADVNAAFPFLEYASQNVIYHAGQAAPGVSQNTYLEQFPLHAWVHTTNALQPAHNRRHSPNVTLLYLHAESGFISLMDTITRDGAWNRIQGERYGYPFLVAFANGQRAVISTFLDRDSPVSVEDITRDRGFGNSSELKAEDDLWLWACKHGNFNVAKYLLTSRRQALGWTASKIHDQLSDGRDALLFAVKYLDISAVKWLSEASAHVDRPVMTHTEVFSHPVSRLPGMAVKAIIIDTGARVTTQGGYYGSVLQAACILTLHTFAKWRREGGDLNTIGGMLGFVLRAATECNVQEKTTKMLESALRQKLQAALAD
ncbi:hypothetical protein PRZ48_006805 [Zasmidium cellare]|uniref:HET-domain-containing protein n=1 Tax=Zasmidium cellare TaxID=395010 RepID=A0ABR0EI02_ZASCE|nr:hypothetical protein PRZ48_006805 [Zasmidium cellare]